MGVWSDCMSRSPLEVCIYIPHVGIIDRYAIAIKYGRRMGRRINMANGRMGAHRAADKYCGWANGGE